MLFYDQRKHICTFLDRQGKICMSAFIKRRVPLSDVNLISYFNSLPGNLRTKRGNKKNYSVGNEMLASRKYIVTASIPFLSFPGKIFHRLKTKIIL